MTCSMSFMELLISPNLIYEQDTTRYEYIQQIFLKLPFVLIMVIMNSIFHPSQIYTSFFYDILIYSPNWIVHLEHVKRLLKYYKNISFCQIQQMCLRFVRIEIFGAYCDSPGCQGGSKQNYSYAKLASAY
jgi:hypothetical protein